MKIAVACGGTGGHVFPGLAVAEKLKGRGHEVILWLSGKGIESDTVVDWDGPVVTVAAEGFPRGNILKCIRAAFRLVGARFECKRKMKELMPSAVLAMGSYASVGPVMSASSLKIPVVLHEANAVPGRAIDFLSGRADTIATSFAGTKQFLPRSKCVFTGLPIRDAFESIPKDRIFESGKFRILVMGGSQGAHAVNEITSQALCTLADKVQVIHLSGKQDEELVRGRYEEAGVEHKVYGFLSEMADAYGSADLAVCRSGASSCAEMSAAGVPSLLIPLPHAPRDHQTANAESMKAEGASDLIAQDDLTPESLCEYISSVIDDREKLAAMKAAALERVPHSAAERVAELVEASAKNE